MTFQALFYPVTEANFDPPLYIAHHEHYRLPSEGMKWFGIAMHDVEATSRIRVTNSWNKPAILTLVWYYKVKLHNQINSSDPLFS